MLRRWLLLHVRSGAKIFTDRIPKTGRVIFITINPGAGLTDEGLIDNPSFNVQCRGGENNYEDAERIALEVDQIILELGSVGFEFEGVQFYLLDRTGGGPQQINVSDTANRFAFSGNYYAKVSTNIGEDYN